MLTRIKQFFPNFNFTSLLLLTIVGLLIYFLIFKKENETTTIEYDTALIQQQIQNVGKLVVTEGHFAEVITYKDQKKYMGDLLSFEKKAIVVINADVSVSFDLSKIKYDIDSVQKVLRISNIPKEEIKISPDYKYYDTEESTFNEFSAEDYNKINKIAKTNLMKKINNSSLQQNAKQRLKEELLKLYSFMNTLKWKIEIDGNSIENNNQIQKISL